MFKYFKNISNVNSIWKLLNEKYFIDLAGKVGNTVIKIDEKSETMKYLLVHTDNENVKNVFAKKEQEILSDIKKDTGIWLTGIKIV